MNPSIEMLNKIEKDFFSMDDHLISAKKVDAIFDSEDKPKIYFPTTNDPFRPEPEILDIHKNALSQFGAKLDIPGQYLTKLYNGSTWQHKLFCATLNDHLSFSDKNNSKLLLRSNNGILKAVLSDRYDRYNSIGVLTTFLDEMTKNKFDLGNIYYDGITYFVEMNNKKTPIMINDEPHWVSVQYRNSDFGQSALDVKMMLVKQICSNGMVLNTIMRSIHKGKQITTAGDFKLSDKTLNLESQLKKSVIQDVIPQVLSEENLLRLTQNFETLNKIETTVDAVIQKLPSVGASKTDLEAVKNILMNNDPASGVTKGGNVLRVANAVSWMANRYELEDAQPANKYKEMSGNLLSKYVKF